MLCDILIKSGKLAPWPDNCVCCPAGRPIVASQVRDYIFTDRVSDHDPDEHYYIFCIGPGSKGHVYYGTRDRCIYGTGCSERDGSTLSAIEYYAGIKDASKWTFKTLDPL
ncbi:hypothetical protein AAVH_20245 [Aphelenchoides avenae]|nr:hypothetical protein AAVH_20245 [Aphelenchus avenae]